MKEQLCISTPMGEIRARLNEDPEYPGIDIYLFSAGGVETNLALVEYVPGGAVCEGSDHIPGDIIPDERTTLKKLEWMPECERAFRVLTPGLMVRVWNDRERDDPISIAFGNMRNTRIEYLYTDAFNYKVRNVAIVAGTITEEQVAEIIGALDDGEFFIPSLVGLPEKRFEKYDPADDHPWFTLEASGFSVTEDVPTVKITAEALYQKFLEHSAEKGGWERV